MELGLNERVIVVTGGASGIGAAITRLCLAEGATVVVLSRISPGVEEFLQELHAAGKPCELIPLELDDPAACERAIVRVQETYGRIDGLVNNAGFNDSVGLAAGSPERFVESLRQNLLHAYALAHYALPLLKQSRGSIVNIASKVAITGQGNTSGYAAAKGGLLALTREWAVELAPFGIRVNAVIPAEVMTPAYERWISSDSDPAAALRTITAQIPLERRMTTPEEIASTAVFLLSPTQSSHTTGQQLIVDGGYVHLDRRMTATSPATPETSL